jgi:hypothetical protein
MFHGVERNARKVLKQMMAGESRDEAKVLIRTKEENGSKAMSSIVSSAQKKEAECEWSLFRQHETCDTR